MSETVQQQFVTILSFSRSGSSLLAQLLDRVCDVSFGEPIEHQSSTSANAQGYFENEQIVKINDDVLRAGGGSVFQPPEVDFCLRLSRTEVEEQVHRMKMVTALSAGHKHYYGWKDPRTAFTLPLWRLAVPAAKAVVIVRSPSASSASYQAQYGTDVPAASRLWFDSYYRIFRHSAGMPRHVISFEFLISKPAEVALSIARFLGVPLSTEEAEARAREVIRTELIRFSSRTEPASFSAHVDSDAKFLHYILSQTLDAGLQPDYGFLGSVLSGLHTFNRMHRQAEQEAELVRLRAGLQRAEKLAFERMDELEVYGRALAECQSLVRERDQKIGELKAPPTSSMNSKFPIFDRSRLLLKPLADRIHDLHAENWLDLTGSTPTYSHPDLNTLAQRLLEAKQKNAARILMMGAHLLRAGVNRHIIDLINRGFITHIAMNGAGIIHDYELARIGATTESVARYIRTGEFGLWQETGILNEWVREAAESGLGLGENVGRRILESNFPHRDLSVLAAAYAASIPVTVHVGIGYDILHEHPNCDGASFGTASYRDFLIFARTVEKLEHGVLLSFGSAVMAPEVYLKALAMARNVANPENRAIRHFTTAVFDLVPVTGSFHQEQPKSEAAYYFRPLKTILIRTVADGGESFYFCGDHRATLPALWRALMEQP